MTSRTSFFNLTAFRKNIYRFAPVWSLYTVFLLLIAFGIGQQDPDNIAQDVVYLSALTGVVNLIYAGIVAMCLFGCLYKSRTCNALHAFPMRRGGWLLTNVTAGLLFSFAPNLLVCILATALLGEYAFYTWLLFVVMSLQYLFFFGTAVLSALFAGRKVGMVAVYGIIHFAVALIYYLAEMIYQPLIYGIQLNADNFYRFFPLSRMSDFYINAETRSNELIFQGYAIEQWKHLYICGAVGVAAIVLAWLVYRCRHLERGGELVTLRPLRPIVLIVYTIALGVCFHSCAAMLGQRSYLIYALGIAVGYFTGVMLLKRTVRVFEKKALQAFAVLVVVLAGSMVLTWVDPMGIGSYMPALDKIESATIYGPDKSYYYYTEEYDAFVMTDSEEIKEIQSLHEELLAERPGDEDYCDVQIRYNLVNGKTVDRYYRVQINSPLAKELGQWFSDSRCVFQMENPAELYQKIAYFSVDKYGYEQNQNLALKYQDPEQIEGLLNAILADCADGTISQVQSFHNQDAVYSINFEVQEEITEDIQDIYRFRTLSIYNDCTNTIAYLEKLFTEIS